MIRLASENDIVALRNIWQVCFGDTDDYLDLYFNNCFNIGHTYVYLDGNKPISMLTILPVDYHINGRNEKLGYIYAAATLPQFQGSGIMAKMLEFAKMLAKKQGLYGLCLVPGGEELFSYYKKHGFNTTFYHRVGEYAYNVVKVADTSINKLSASEYIEKRDSFSRKYNFLHFSSEMNVYIAKELEFTGHFFISGSEFYACIRENHGQKYIRELICKDENLENALNVICSWYKADIKVRLPSDIEFAETKLTPYAMTWIVEKAKLTKETDCIKYANLLLD